jgi:uncharacterized RDD family membrane protein YckC
MCAAPTCPICSQTKTMRRTKSLYGYTVCAKCSSRFANRRQIGFVLDSFLLYFLYPLAGGMFGTVLGAMGPVSESAINAASWAVLIACWTIFIAKDGIAGSSPGKWLTGVRAVDVDSLQPIGFVASIKRNLPTLIPIVPLVIGVQLIKGYRWGDDWARSKVIWNKYADNPVFTGQPLTEVDEFQQAPAALAPGRETGNPYQAPRH